MSFGDGLFPDGPVVRIFPLCKRCEAGTPAARCGKCGGEQAACAVCGRCPDCDGPV